LKFALPAPATATITLNGAGHHLPFESPHAFAAAALHLVRGGAWRT
jgi:pimeloyl-ACP methyl ester carboxylesterase